MFCLISPHTRSFLSRVFRAKTFAQQGCCCCYLFGWLQNCLFSRYGTTVCCSLSLRSCVSVTLSIWGFCRKKMLLFVRLACLYFRRLWICWNLWFFRWLLLRSDLLDQHHQAPAFAPLPGARDSRNSHFFIRLARSTNRQTEAPNQPHCVRFTTKIYSKKW